MQRISAVEVGTVQQGITRWKKEDVPIINIHDKQGSTELSLFLLINELLEAKLELELKNEAAELLELIDVIVILLSFYFPKSTTTFSENVANHPVTLNGVGRHDDFYDVAIEMAANVVLDGLKDRDAEHFVSWIMARIKLLLYEKTLVQSQEEVQEKNDLNHEKKYYQVEGNPKKSQVQDNIEKKYGHSMKLLKQLRKHYGSPLPTWAHEPFSELILDYNIPNAEKILEQGITQLDTALYNWYVFPENRRLVTPHQKALLKVARRYGIENENGTLKPEIFDHALVHGGGAVPLKGGVIYSRG